MEEDRLRKKREAMERRQEMYDQ
jgi:hypothetical protein